MANEIRDEEFFQPVRDVYVVEDGGAFRVEAITRFACDDMWTNTQHVALFASRFDAMTLASKVRTRHSINLTHWAPPGHVALENVPRPDSGRSQGFGS